MFKIIGTSNFDNESVADFTKDEWQNLTQEEATCIVEKLNTSNRNGSTFYLVVSQDYRLWRGMEELI